MIEVRRGASVLFQEAHPGAPIPDALHAAIQWRLLFPLLGRVLDLGPLPLFALADLGCLFALALIVAVLRRRGADWTRTLSLTLLLGAGSWFFASVSWLGYYDSWLVLGLLIVGFGRSDWAVWLACLWAPWVDERFAAAFPLALLCRYLDRGREAATPGADRPGLPGSSGAQPANRTSAAAGFGRAALPAAALVALFLAIRLGVLPRFSAAGATVGGYLAQQRILGAPLSRLCYGAWEGLRMGWILVAAGAWAAWRANRASGLFLAACTAGVALIGLATAQDLSRSMAMVLPVAMLGALAAAPGARRMPAWLPAGAAAALLLPAHLVMTNRVNPIFYLYHELASLRSPPAAAMPELYELRGILAMEDGRRAQAESDLTLAIRLSDDPTLPCRQRGVLYASQGRWTEARRDFETMTGHQPGNPDGWFLLAQADLAMGDPSAARTEFGRAEAAGSTEWAGRTDVARFRRRLEGQP